MKNIRFGFDVEKILSIGGVFLSIVLIIYLFLTYNRIVYIIIGFLTLFACLLWLYIKNKNLDLSDLDHLSNHNLYYLTCSMFFIILTINLLILYTRPEMYIRPIISFILSAILVLLISLSIVFSSGSKRQIILALSEIIILGLFIDFSQVFIFPTYVGVDTWSHLEFVESIVNNGHIPQNFPYSNMPIFHVEVSYLSILIDLNSKISAFLTITFLQVLSNSILLYLFGKCFYNHKIGLLSALLLLTSNLSISSGISPIPFTLGSIFILYILYFIFKFKKNGFVFSMILFILMIPLIITHTIAAVALAVILVIILLIPIFLKKFNLSNKFISFTLLLFFLVSMVSWWMYASGQSLSVFGEILKWGFSLDYFIRTPASVLSTIKIPVTEQILYSLSTFLFYSLSLIGFFYMISKRYGTKNSFTYGIIGILMLSIGFFPFIFKISFVEQRWIYISQVMLTIPLSITIFLLFNLLKEKHKLTSFLIFGLVIFSISLLALTSPQANIDNPTFFPHSTPRYAMTESEMQSIYTTSKYWNGIFGGEEFLSQTVLKSMGFYTRSIDSGLFEKDFSKYKDMLILVRSEIIYHPFKLFSTIYKLDYNPELYLDREYYNKIYDIGTVQGYLKLSKN